jgi:hypothetical protein
MPTQLRRYELDPALVDEWLAFFPELTRVRATFGFRLLGAYHDRAGHEFTWIVEHDRTIADVEAEYYASPERAALFAGRPEYALAMHVTAVEPIDAD